MPDYRINVVINPNTRPGAQKVERDLKRIEKRSNAVRSSMARMLGVLGGGAILFKAVRTMAQFEQVMSTVAGVTNATAKEMELLTRRAKELGISTRFTATQAGEGLVELSRAGLSVKDSLDAVGSSLVLAQAGSLGLAEAADLTTTAIKVFKLEATDAAEVADVLVIAANSSKTNVSEMGQAFTFAAANANDLELSVQETAAALAVLAEGGLKATRGGTAFRSILLGLAAPSAAAKEVLLGISDNMDDFDIKARGIVPVLELLASAELDVEQKTAIFGKRFGAAASIMFANIPKFKEVIEKFQTMGGEAQRVADVMDDNLNGAILKMKSAFEGLILEIGAGGASGAFRGLFSAITDGLRGMARNIDTVMDSLEALIILLAIKFARFAVGAAIGALRSLGIALLTNPIGVFVTALSLGITLLVAFGDELQLVSGEATTFGDFMAASAEVALMALEGLSDFLHEVFAPLFAALGADAGSGMKDMITAVAFGLDAVAGLFRATFSAIGAALDFSLIQSALLGGVVGAANTFIGIIETAFNALAATIIGTMDAIRANAIGALNVAVAAAELVKQRAIPFNAPGNIARAQREFDEAAEKFDASSITRAIKTEFDRLEAAEPLGRLANPWSEEAGNLGDAMGAAWTEAFKIQAEGGAMATLEGIFDRADEIARQREADAAAAAAQAAADAATGAAAGPDAERTKAAKEQTAANTKRNTTLDEYRKGLQQEMSLLRMSAGAREIANELLHLENDLREENLTLTDAQRESLTIELEKLQVMQLQADIIEELRGPSEDLAKRQEAINDLMRTGQITTDEYNRALRDLAKQSAATAGTIGSTIQPGLETIGQQLFGMGQFAEQTLGRVFKGLEDALVQFVTTGEVSFGQLVDSMLKDIARLLVQQGLQLLLGLLTGGAGAGIGGILSSVVGGATGGGGGQPAYVGGGSYSGGGGAASILGGSGST